MIKKWLPSAAALRRSRNDIDACYGNVNPAGVSIDDGASTPPIDVAALSRAINAPDNSLAQEMLRLFRDEEVGTVTKLRELIDARDWESLTRVAHTAKGAARSAFAHRLADLCEGLETSAKLADWANIRALAPDIEAEFQQVMSFIDRFTRTAAGSSVRNRA